jgi:hypothetical protein
LEVGIGAIGRPQKLGLKDLTTNWQTNKQTNISQG